jgi:uncharacterized repeat protein (TIGR01451 family)
LTLNPSLRDAPSLASFVALILAGPALCVGQTLSYNRIDLTAGVAPWKVAIADFNHDGKPDIAYLLSGSGVPSVSILLGQGNGVFVGPITTTLSTAAAAKILTVGDLNNDGFPDVITYDFDNNTIYILIGNGDGTFQTPRTIHNSSAEGFAIGDFNGDGKADFAATVFSGSVVIYLGNGDGSFNAGSPISTGGNGSNAVVACDFNHDGKLDLAITNMFSSNVSVMLGNGDGTFAQPVLYPLDAASAPQALALGDVNGDGIPDIVVAETSNFMMAVLLGNGNGSFTNTGTFALHRYIYDVALADLNGDGKLDIVAATNFGTTNTSFVTALLGNGNGAFGTAMDFAVGPAAQSVAVGDLNGDGIPDIAATGWAGNVISVLTSGPPINVFPFFTLSKSHSGNFTPGQLGATFTISAGNPSASPTSGIVTVTDQLPAGLTLVAMSGVGWACTSNTCSRADPLGPGSSYPAITVTVNVQPGVGSSLTNMATAATNASTTTASDTVTISGGPPAPSQVSPSNGATGVTATPTLSWSASGGATSYDVYSGTTSPPPLLANTTTTSYVSGTLLSNTTYYWRVVAKNGGASTSSATWTFTTQTGTPPTITTSVSPASGSALQQTFTVNVSDTAGAADVSAIFLYFNASFSPSANACLIEYYRPTNTLYLLNNAGTAWPSISVGSAGTLSNSQCSVNAANASASLSGASVVLTLPVVFTSNYSGVMNVYAYAAGASANSGWETVGTWTLPAAVNAVSVSPTAGSRLQQTFAVQYSDSVSATDLSTMFVYFNATFSPSSNSCLVEYSRPSNILYLLNDAGNAWSSVSVGSSVSLSNSQCSISAASTSVNLSANGLLLNLPVTFAATYLGAKNIYAYAAGSSANSGWQTLGSWTVPGSAVVNAVSVSPASGSGMQQTFTLQYSDSVSANDLSTMFVYFNATFSTSSNSCLVEFYGPSSTLYLLNDAGNAWSAITVGSSTPLSNSQCSINAASASVNLSANGLLLNLPVTFSPAFAGVKNSYAYATGSSANSGWQTLGSWTVQ